MLRQCSFEGAAQTPNCCSNGEAKITRTHKQDPISALLRGILNSQQTRPEAATGKTHTHTERVQVPKIEGLWSPNNHQEHGCWNQKPQILGTWTLRDTRGSQSLVSCTRIPELSPLLQAPEALVLWQLRRSVGLEVPAVWALRDIGPHGTWLT